MAVEGQGNETVVASPPQLLNHDSPQGVLDAALDDLLQGAVGMPSGGWAAPTARSRHREQEARGPGAGLLHQQPWRPLCGAHVSFQEL